MKFNFEKNLAHQTHAVDSTVSVFEHLEIIPPSGVDKNHINPVIQIEHTTQYKKNIRKIQTENGITHMPATHTNIIDIMMETGTGKTYTYTKTMFELNKHFGIFKFIIVVPTLSIKAGTINFLKNPGAKEHFKEQYNKTLKLHIVESQKQIKNKKAFIPTAISAFVNAGSYEKNSIQVLIINAGMINSETMQKSFDTNLFDIYSIPFEALSAVKPFVIIDEPHKFATVNKTWENIQKMNAQYILRYGATFPEKEIKQKNSLTGKTEIISTTDYQNLVYTLSAMDSFNRNLVKGVVGHITEFENGKNAFVKLVNTNGKEAVFEVQENRTKKSFALIKKDSLQKIHTAMSDLFIENINTKKVVLSNGIELRKGDKINPYSYAEKLQEIMIQKAIKNHFAIEKELLTREVKIKPLTLFFIDNIEEYRNKNGSVKNTIENLIKSEINCLLKREENPFYQNYLKKSLQDIQRTHGGYFSKDNSQKDEEIEKEITEILHDNQALLDVNNPRRFIFSKWTLREGWDNPNVFQICKLRSSGSEISKLQEVGRGLRLPVNEYGNRVKDEQFYLHYFVDFTESDFVEGLVQEINQKSGTISALDKPTKLSDAMIQSIITHYPSFDENTLLQTLTVDKKVIDFSRTFLAGGFDYIKNTFPNIFNGVHENKIYNATELKKKITVRTEKYSELKNLWEKLNEKVILEYKFESEEHFKEFFIAFLNKEKDFFTVEGIQEKTAQIEITAVAEVKESQTIYGNEVIPISTMKYSDFLKELARLLHINIKTLHSAFTESDADINRFLNHTTIRIIKQKFEQYLLYNAIDTFGIEYKKVSNKIHPTKLTDETGSARKELPVSDVGFLYSENKVSDTYFLNELFYDSELEKENIKQNLEGVVVFTKIPKNSIKIPVSGGKTYSPDFAYVFEFKDKSKKLYFIVETKNTADAEALRKEEQQKIRHAEQFFGNAIKITFKTQFNNKGIADLIREIHC